MTSELIAAIVKQVLATLPRAKRAGELVKEVDSTGLRLVKGSSVVCEKLNTGRTDDGVAVKEIFNKKECPQMTTGFMTLEQTNYFCLMNNEEVYYLIDGTMEVEVKGNIYRGEAGDVFYLPKNTAVTLSTKEQAKIFFVTYPANQL
nr:cupin domain-containing protein [Desulforamulus aquiferis]